MTDEELVLAFLAGNRPAFDELFEHADHDPTRPLIEFYRREGEVDCLVPVTAAVPVA